MDKIKLKNELTSADLIIRVECFNLKNTLECGQCFRWIEKSKNEYVGILDDRVIRIINKDNYIYVYSNKKENLETVVRNYFDLNTDYCKIESSISKIDDNICKAVINSSGIHILRQPIFETCISYIISANNNIKRISRSVNEISRIYGKRVEFENEIYYLFPTLEDLFYVTEEEFRRCGVGFRDKYLVLFVKKLINEDINLNIIYDMNINDAKKFLLDFMGIGPKVADCILLFGFGKKQVFPIDVWVKKIMERLYFKKNVSIKEIEKYAKEHFFDYAGIIQQHLFYNVRENML